MDFIFGIITFIIFILIIVNFVSIGISNTSGGTCENNTIGNSLGFGSLFGMDQSRNQTQIQTQMQMQNYGKSIPSPVQSNAPSALNNKINLNNQTYDYSQYFFI